MAQGFNIVARLHLQGPTNVSQVVQQLQKQLSSVNVKINAQVSPQASKAAQQTSQSLNNLNQSATKANTSVTQLGKTTARTGSSVAQASKNFQEATTAATAFGKASALAVKRFAAFTVGAGIIGGLVVSLKNGVSAAVEFEREMVKVAQVTGQTLGSLGGLQKEIGSLSSSLGVASSDLVVVARTLSQTGIAASEVKKALKALAQSALAPTFKDMSNTVEGAISIMRQFGVTADDIGKKLGSINALAGSFAVEAQDLVFAVRRAGGAFKAAGGSLEELLALFTSVRATTRESAETIATGFRTIFTRVQRPKTIAFLREAGIELQNLSGQFVGPYEAVRRLSKGLKELESTDPRFQQIIEELGGFRQVSKVIPLIQQFSTAQKALGVAMAGQGSLAKDAVKAQQTLAVQITKVREQFLALMRDIAGGDTFKNMASTALTVASSFLQVADALKPILPLMAGLAAFQGLRFGAQFGSGFFSGIRGGGGAKGAGRGLSGGMTGSGSSSVAATKQVQALSSNTAALLKLNTQMSTLSSAINKSIASTNKLSASVIRGAGPMGGRRGRRKFATGGMVPGQGSGDTVPAMLEPGEFVIRKSSVEKYGASNLARMNVGGKLGDVSRKRRLRGGARGAHYASSRSNRFARRMGGGKKKAYAFDFDDTLAVSDAVVREGEADPFSDFRGAKGGKFIRSARATRYASMARRRASRGHDIHVVTARPGDKATKSGINHFMRGIGAPAKSVIGVGGFSADMGGTGPAKASEIRRRLAPLYEKVIFLDDDRENTIAASQVKKVRAVHVGPKGLSRTRLKKQFGGSVQKYMVGTVGRGASRRDITSGAGLVSGTAALMRTRTASKTPGSKVTREFEDGRTSNAEVLGKQAASNAQEKARGMADPDWYGGAFLRPGNRNVLYKGVNDKEEIRKLIKKTPGFVKFQNIKNSIDKGAKGSKAKFVRELEKGEKKIIGTYASRNKYHVETGSLSKGKSTEMEGRLLKGVHDTVKSGAKVLSKTLKTKFDNSSVSKAMKQANIDQTLGNLFGQILMYAGGRWSPKDADAANSPWDFPKGLRGVSKDFAIKKTHVKTDAKTSFTNSNIKSLMHKVDTQNAVEAQTELDSVFSELASSPALKGKSFVRGVGEDLGVNKRRKRRGYAAGGGIPAASDTVPALLTPGEFVVNKKSAQSVGYGALNSLNKGTKRVQGYAAGGVVQRFARGGKSKGTGGGMGGGGMLTLLFAIDMLAASFSNGNKALERWVGVLSATGTAMIAVKSVLESFASAESLRGIGQGLQHSGVQALKGGPGTSGLSLARMNVSKFSKAVGHAKIGLGKMVTGMSAMIGPMSTVAAGMVAAYVAANILATQFKQAGMDMLASAKNSSQENAAKEEWLFGMRIDNAAKIGAIVAGIAAALAIVVGAVLTLTGVGTPAGIAMVGAGAAVLAGGVGATLGWGQNVSERPFQEATVEKRSRDTQDRTQNLLKQVNSSGLGLSGSTGQQAVSAINKQFNLMIAQTDPDKRSAAESELKRTVPELQNMITLILESGEDFGTAMGGLGPAILELIAKITGVSLDKLTKETEERDKLMQKLKEAQSAKEAEAAETRNVTMELQHFNAALQGVVDSLSGFEQAGATLTAIGTGGDVEALFGTAPGRGGIIGRAAEGQPVNLSDFNQTVGMVSQDPTVRDRASGIAELNNKLPQIIREAALAAGREGSPGFRTELKTLLEADFGLLDDNPLIASVFKNLNAIVNKTTTEQGGPSATLGKMIDDPQAYVQDALAEGDTAFLNELQRGFDMMAEAQAKINNLMKQRMQLERALLDRQMKVRRAEKQLEDFDRSQERGGRGRVMTLREINERESRDQNTMLGGTRAAGMAGNPVGLGAALGAINERRANIDSEMADGDALELTRELGNLNNEAMRVTSALQRMGNQTEKLAKLQSLLAREQKKRQLKENMLLKLAFGDENDAQEFVDNIMGSFALDMGVSPQMMPPGVRSNLMNFLQNIGDTQMDWMPGSPTGTDLLRKGLVSYLKQMFPNKDDNEIAQMVDPIINATMEEKRIQRQMRDTLIEQIIAQKILAGITQAAIHRQEQVIEAAIQSAEHSIVAAIQEAEASRLERKAAKDEKKAQDTKGKIDARKDINNNEVWVDKNGDGVRDPDEGLDSALTPDESNALPGASGSIIDLGQSGGQDASTLMVDANGDGIPDGVAGGNMADIGNVTVVEDTDHLGVGQGTFTSVDSRPDIDTDDTQYAPILDVDGNETGDSAHIDMPTHAEVDSDGNLTVPATYGENMGHELEEDLEIDGNVLASSGDTAQFGKVMNEALDGITDPAKRSEIIQELVKKFYGKDGIAGTNLSDEQVGQMSNTIMTRQSNLTGSEKEHGGEGVAGEFAVQEWFRDFLAQQAAAANEYEQKLTQLSQETGIAVEKLRQLVGNLELLDAYLKKIREAGDRPLSELQTDHAEETVTAEESGDAAKVGRDKATDSGAAADESKRKGKDAQKGVPAKVAAKRAFKAHVSTHISSPEHGETAAQAQVRAINMTGVWDAFAPHADRDKGWYEGTDIGRWKHGGLADFNKGQIMSGEDAGPLSQGTDDMLGLVHRGEYLVPASKARKNLPLLDAIRSGRDNLVPKFSGGGVVGALGKQISAAGGGIGFGDVSSSLNFGKVAEEITGGTKLKQLYNELQKINASIQGLPQQIPGPPPPPVAGGGGGAAAVLRRGGRYLSEGGGAPAAGPGPTGPGPVSAGTGSPAGNLTQSTDTRLAVLTPGEFVVNKDATSQNLGLLEMINSGVYARTGGLISHFQAGGNVPPPAYPGMSQQVWDGLTPQQQSSIRRASGNPSSNAQVPYAGNPPSNWKFGQSTVEGGTPKGQNAAMGAPVGDETAYKKWKSDDKKHAKMIQRHMKKLQSNDPNYDNSISMQKALEGESGNSLGPQSRAALAEYQREQDAKYDNDDGYKAGYDHRQEQRKDRLDNWEDHTDFWGDQAYVDKDKYLKARDESLYTHMAKRRMIGEPVGKPYRGKVEGRGHFRKGGLYLRDGDNSMSFLEMSETLDPEMYEKARQEAAAKEAAKSAADKDFVNRLTTTTSTGESRPEDATIGASDKKTGKMSRVSFDRNQYAESNWKDMTDEELNKISNSPHWSNERTRLVDPETGLPTKGGVALTPEETKEELEKSFPGGVMSAEDPNVPGVAGGLLGTIQKEAEGRAKSVRAMRAAYKGSELEKNDLAALQAMKDRGEKVPKSFEELKADRSGLIPAVVDSDGGSRSQTDEERWLSQYEVASLGSEDRFSEGHTFMGFGAGRLKGDESTVSGKMQRMAEDENYRREELARLEMSDDQWDDYENSVYRQFLKNHPNPEMINARPGTPANAITSPTNENLNKQRSTLEVNQRGMSFNEGLLGTPQNDTMLGAYGIDARGLPYNSKGEYLGAKEGQQKMHHADKYATSGDSAAFKDVDRDEAYAEYSKSYDETELQMKIAEQRERGGGANATHLEQRMRRLDQEASGHERLAVDYGMKTLAASAAAFTPAAPVAVPVAIGMGTASDLEDAGAMERRWEMGGVLTKRANQVEAQIQRKEELEDRLAEEQKGTDYQPPASYVEHTLTQAEIDREVESRQNDDGTFSKFDKNDNKIPESKSLNALEAEWLARATWDTDQQKLEAAAYRWRAKENHKAGLEAAAWMAIPTAASLGVEGWFRHARYAKKIASKKGSGEMGIPAKNKNQASRRNRKNRITNIHEFPKGKQLELDPMDLRSGGLISYFAKGTGKGGKSRKLTTEELTAARQATGNVTTNPQYNRSPQNTAVSMNVDNIKQSDPALRRGGSESIGFGPGSPGHTKSGGPGPIRRGVNAVVGEMTGYRSAKRTWGYMNKTADNLTDGEYLKGAGNYAMTGLNTVATLGIPGGIAAGTYMAGKAMMSSATATPEVHERKGMDDTEGFKERKIKRPSGKRGSAVKRQKLGGLISYFAKGTGKGKSRKLTTEELTAARQATGNVTTTPQYSRSPQNTAASESVENIKQGQTGVANRKNDVATLPEGEEFVLTKLEPDSGPIRYDSDDELGILGSPTYEAPRGPSIMENPRRFEYKDGAGTMSGADIANERKGLKNAHDRATERAGNKGRGMTTEQADAHNALMQFDRDLTLHDPPTALRHGVEEGFVTNVLAEKMPSTSVEPRLNKLTERQMAKQYERDMAYERMNPQKALESPEIPKNSVVMYSKHLDDADAAGYHRQIERGDYTDPDIWRQEQGVPDLGIPGRPQDSLPRRSQIVINERSTKAGPGVKAREKSKAARRGKGPKTWPERFFGRRGRSQPLTPEEIADIKRTEEVEAHELAHAKRLNAHSDQGKGFERPQTQAAAEIITRQSKRGDVDPAVVKQAEEQLRKQRDYVVEASQPGYKPTPGPENMGQRINELYAGANELKRQALKEPKGSVARRGMEKHAAGLEAQGHILDEINSNIAQKSRRNPDGEIMDQEELYKAQRVDAENHLYSEGIQRYYALHYSGGASEMSKTERSLFTTVDPKQWPTHRATKDLYRRHIANNVGATDYIEQHMLSVTQMRGQLEKAKAANIKPGNVPPPLRRRAGGLISYFAKGTGKGKSRKLTTEELTAARQATGNVTTNPQYNRSPLNTDAAKSVDNIKQRDPVETAALSQKEAIENEAKAKAVYEKSLLRDAENQPKVSVDTDEHVADTVGRFQEATQESDAAHVSLMHHMKRAFELEKRSRPVPPQYNLENTDMGKYGKSHDRRDYQPNIPGNMAKQLYPDEQGYPLPPLRAPLPIVPLPKLTTHITDWTGEGIPVRQNPWNDVFGDMQKPQPARARNRGDDFDPSAQHDGLGSSGDITSSQDNRRMDPDQSNYFPSHIPPSIPNTQPVDYSRPPFTIDEGPVPGLHPADSEIFTLPPESSVTRKSGDVNVRTTTAEESERTRDLFRRKSRQAREEREAAIEDAASIGRGGLTESQWALIIGGGAAAAATGVSMWKHDAMFGDSDRKRTGGLVSYLSNGGDLKKDNRIMPLPDVTPGQGHLNISSPDLNDNPAKHIQDMMEVIYGRSRIGTDNKTGKAKAFPGGRRKREMGKESWMSDRKGNLAKKGKGMDPNIAEELFPSFYAKQPWLDTKSEEEDHLFFLGQEEFGSEEERNAFLGSRNFPEMFTGGHLRYNRGMGSGEGAYSPSSDRVQLPQRDVVEMGLFQSLNRRTLDISPLGQATLHEGQQHRATNEMLLQEGRKMMGLPSGSEYPRAFETGDSRQPRITGAHTFGKGELTTGLTFPSGERTDFDKMLKEMSPDVFKATKAYQRNTGIQSTWEEDRGKPGTGERKDFWEIFGKDKGTNFQKYATGGDELMARVRTIADWNAMNDPNVLEALGKLEKGESTTEEILDIYRNTQRMNSSLGLDEEGNPDIRQSWKNIQKYRKAMDKNYPKGSGPRGVRNMGMQRQTLEAMLGDEEQKKHLSELLILARKSGGPITRLEEGGGTGMGSAGDGASTSTGGPVSHGTGVPAGDLTRSTDTRLTALTPGEFVVNKSMTDMHRGLLEQINSGQYVRDGGVIYKHGGGATDREKPPYKPWEQPGLGTQTMPMQPYTPLSPQPGFGTQTMPMQPYTPLSPQPGFGTQTMPYTPPPQVSGISGPTAMPGPLATPQPGTSGGPQGQPIDFNKLTEGASTIKEAFQSFADTLVGLDFASKIKEAFEGEDMFRTLTDTLNADSALTKSLNDFVANFGGGQIIPHEMTFTGLENVGKLDPSQIENLKSAVQEAVAAALSNQESAVNRPA